MATESTIPDELGGVSNYNDAEPGGGYETPAEEAPWAPSQEEWGSVVSYIQAQQEREYAAQQADYEAQLEALFDPNDLGYDPQAGLAAIQHLVAQQVQPALQYIEQQQYAAALDEATDIAYDLLGQFGVPDEKADAVYDAAERGINDAIAQVGVQDVHELASWLSAQTGESHDEARNRIGTVALELAANEATQGEQYEALGKYYRAGGQLSDLIGATGELSAPQTRFDYRRGGSVADRIFNT
jgi:hypothetical protein